MSTNYYLKVPNDCKNRDALERIINDNGWIHLGKSSSGWRYSLRIYPDLGINFWNNQQDLILTTLSRGGWIEDEYCRDITFFDYKDIVEERGEGLVKHDSGSFCVGQDFTFPIDYFSSDFS